MEFLGNISAFLVNLSTSANLQSTTTLAAAAGVVALFATFMAASSSKSPKQYKKLTKPGDGKVILCAMMQSESSINYSPFVVKLFASLKGSGVNFELGSVSWDQLPTSKIPIVHFNGEILTDSQLIIKRLIKEGLAIDPDEWLNDEEENSIRAQSEMLRLAAEQFLYWGLVQERWDDSWKTTRELYFKDFPWFLRQFIPDRIARPSVLKNLYCQGTSRYPRPEWDEMMVDFFKNCSSILADKKFMFSNHHKTMADYSLFGIFVNVSSFPQLTPKLDACLTSHSNLMEYTDRLKQEIFPDLIRNGETTTTSRPQSRKSPRKGL